jgi:type I restriction enzyme S subunit
MRTEGCIHDGWLVLSPRSGNVDADFFYYLLGSKAVYAEFERRASGATVKNLNIDLVRGVTVPLPPLPEQRRIAEILDKADALRAKRRAALAQLDTLTQSIFLDMFGDPATNPKRWPTVSLESKCTIAGEYGASVPSKEFDQALPRYVRITDVTDEGELSDGPVSPGGRPNDWERYELAAGDVLFARSGATVGKTYIHREEHGRCVFAGYMIRFRPDPRELLPEDCCL